jgi:hypothetical protein
MNKIAPIQGVVKDTTYVDRAKQTAKKVPTQVNGMENTLDNKIDISKGSVTQNVEKAAPLMRQSTKLRQGEDYGVRLDKIVHRQSQSFYFEDETSDGGRVMVYSSHKTVIGNSTWQQFHQSIKGDFYDEEFDCLGETANNRDKVDPMYGLKRCSDSYDQKKL